MIGPDRLTISSRSGPGTAFRDWPGVQWTSDDRELAARSEVAILSVRPQNFRSLVISVMAGVSSQTLARRSRSERIVRAMPNAAVEIGRSYTPWFTEPG